MAKTHRFPFTLSATKTGRTLCIVMSGYIDPEGRNCSAAVAEKLALLGPKDKLEVLLRNLYGGNVFEGMTIYHDLVARKPAMKVDGVCASMAMPIALAGETIEASKHSRFMLHRVQGGAGGDADQIAQYAAQAQELEDEIAAIIATKTGMSDADVKATYMVSGRDTWLTADQALKAKLVDKVTAGSLLTAVPKEDEYTDAEDAEGVLASWHNCLQIENNPGSAGQTEAMNKEQLAKLGLPENATEAQVNAKLDELTNKATQVDTLRQAENERVEKEATDLIDGALQTNRLTQPQADVLKAEVKKAPVMALSMVKATLGNAPAHKPASEQLRQGGNAPENADRANWTYLDWTQKDSKGLARMQANDLAKFTALKAAYLESVKRD